LTIDDWGQNASVVDRQSSVVAVHALPAHPNPEAAVCDGPQQIADRDFAAYAAKVEQAAMLAGKRAFRPQATAAS